MTGFGRSRFALGGCTYRLELRSLNHRYLDIHVRLPWPDSTIEASLYERLRSALARGRVDLTLSVEPGSAPTTRLVLNRALAQDLGRALSELANLLECEEATAARLLPAPEHLLVATDSSRDTEAILSTVLAAFDEALAGLLHMRREEGAAHKKDMQRHADQLGQLTDEIAALAQAEPMRLQGLLERRLARLVAEGVDPVRLAQEVAMLADRADVSEELDRLRSHLQQLRAIFDEAGPVGRKVEFLLQEVQREVNTTGSKTQHSGISRIVVEAKTTLEKMRELCQNLE